MTSKPASTLTQLQNLMQKHTAVSQPKPAEIPLTATTPTRPLAPLYSRMPSVPATASPIAYTPQSSERLTVRLLPQEIQQVDALILDAHQRLGERLSLSEILRIGLSRLSKYGPINADELTGRRTIDRRRMRTAGQGNPQA